MNGFKFTNLKCLAMMILIIIAFCGDAGQYLLMAAALVWMFAKVLELHRSRKKEPSVQKGKAPAKSAAAPAVQPVQASRPAAPVQQPKPAVPRPQLIDPEMEGVMLRHINFRITEKLQGAFPSATWRWETAKPLKQAVKGGSARIRLSGVPDWNFADVLFERSGRIRLEMLSLRPLEEMQKPAKEGPAADGDPDSVNLRDWYDLSASAVVRATIDEVYTHGYRELRIAEDGALYVLEQQVQVGQGQLSYLPGKKLWADLVPLFEEDDITATVEEDSILLTWAN